MLPTLDPEPETCFSSFQRKTHRSYRDDRNALVPNGDFLTNQKKNERDWKKRNSPWDPKLSGSMSIKKKNFKYLHQCFSNFFFSHDPLKKWTTCHKLWVHTHAHTPVCKYFPLPSIMHSNTFCSVSFFKNAICDLQHIVLKTLP